MHLYGPCGAGAGSLSCVGGKFQCRYESQARPWDSDTIDRKTKRTPSERDILLTVFLFLNSLARPWGVPKSLGRWPFLPLPKHSSGWQLSAAVRYDQVVSLHLLELKIGDRLKICTTIGWLFGYRISVLSSVKLYNLPWRNL